MSCALTAGIPQMTDLNGAAVQGAFRELIEVRSPEREPALQGRSSQKRTTSGG
jgi:hypothetical protein